MALNKYVAQGMCIAMSVDSDEVHVTDDKGDGFPGIVSSFSGLVDNLLMGD